MTRVDTEIRPHLGGRDGKHVRIAMPTVALWVSLPGAGKEWGTAHAGNSPRLSSGTATQRDGPTVRSPLGAPGMARPYDHPVVTAAAVSH
jgi:hypothetical protein